MRAPASGRRDRDDVATAALLHPRQEAAQSQECRGEVGIDGFLPSLEWDLLEWPRRNEVAAGIGDEAINRSGGVFDFESHLLDLFKVGQIGKHADCPTTFGHNCVADSADRGLIPSVYNDCGTLIGKKRGDRGADPA